MKILVVCQHFYPEQFRINDICFELKKKGHDVTVLTGMPNYPEGKIYKEYRYFKKQKEKIKGVKIERCSLIGRGKTRIKMFINYAWFALFGSLKALIMKKDFDIVYVYQLSPITMVWPAIVVSKIAHIPLIIHCLDQWPISLTIGRISKKSIIYKIATKISKWTYKQAKIITIGSKSFEKYFIKQLNIKKNEKKFIYWPTYAEKDYENIKYEKNDTFDLVFAGNIGPAQSVETIIEAANLLKNKKNIIFHIVGDGLNLENCKELARKYKLKNVIFYGFHKVSEMPYYYKVADIFMITMVNNEVVNNTLPAKIQSYMMAGKPIIGAISGEVKNVVDEANCGICCESLNYKEFAKIILEASKSKKIKEWSTNSKKYYQNNFRKEKCIDKLEEIFELCIRDNDE